jgi:hypothetical protein
VPGGGGAGFPWEGPSRGGGAPVAEETSTGGCSRSAGAAEPEDGGGASLWPHPCNNIIARRAENRRRRGEASPFEPVRCDRVIITSRAPRRSARAARPRPLTNRACATVHSHEGVFYLGCDMNGKESGLPGIGAGRAAGCAHGPELRSLSMLTSLEVGPVGCLLFLASSHSLGAPHDGGSVARAAWRVYAIETGKTLR